MDLHTLDRSGQVRPFVVKLFDTHSIYELARDERPKARSELTAIIAELLECKLSGAELELVADILIQLMEKAEKDLRVAVSEHLCRKNNVPLRLALHLANDEIEVASSLLEHSPVFTDMDLVYILKSKPANYWKYIAKRAALGDELQQLLVDTEDYPTALCLTENMNIRLSDYAMERLCDISRDYSVLAEKLIMRGELPIDIIETMYGFVGKVMREVITDNYDIDPDVIGAVIEEAVEDNVLKINAQQAVVEEARKKFEDDELRATWTHVLNSLRAGNIKNFTTQFAEFTGLDLSLVGKAIKQPSCKALAIICRANDISKADFVSIFLLTNPLRNKGRMVGMNDMSIAVEYFNSVEQDAAQDLLARMLVEAKQAAVSK